MADPLMHHPAFLDIQRALRKAWLLQQCLWLVLLAVGLSGAILFSTGVSVWGWALGCISVAALCFLRWNGPYRRSLVFQYLQEKPKDIVWIYGYQLLRAPLGVMLSNQYRIYFQTRDRQRFSLDIPEKRYMVVMKWLNRILPHAEFGWDDERFERWKNTGQT
ncbi:MAG: hypothetical protein K9I85_05000 [Saprospiraceae bacterium]|nr:hypothetical protein [Saprospiraceae bacterium]